VSTPSTAGPSVDHDTASWLPLIVVVLAQVQASFAVNALTVSMQGITTDLNTPATGVGTAITAGTFAMAAFVLLGAKVGAKYGSKRVFQIAVLIHGLTMAGGGAATVPFACLRSNGASAGDQPVRRCPGAGCPQMPFLVDTRPSTCGRTHRPPARWAS
jgi:MFS family permease